MDFVIKLLDLDAVFSEQSLKMTLENYDCSSDEDCDFFDCKGHCIKVRRSGRLLRHPYSTLLRAVLSRSEVLGFVLVILALLSWPWFPFLTPSE